MKYLTEFREQNRVKKLVAQIEKVTTKNWKIMEVCGGQTHAITKYGIIDLLPKQIELIHGPGCPVCVTPKPIIDAAQYLSLQKNIIFCSFGDMLRVPGSETDLLDCKANGAELKMLYSPIEAVQVAQNNPDKTVILFAVGFETTAPTHAMAIYYAKEHNLKNFFVLTSLVLVPPALEFILQSPHNHVQGFLAAGHVCTIMGTTEYQSICEKYKVPIVVTGFEPVDILQGLYRCIVQLESDQSDMENQYQRCVKPQGNIFAQNILNSVFKVEDFNWRGIGLIPQSGLVLSDEFREFDALAQFELRSPNNFKEQSQCISGQILQGIKKPNECPLYCKQCTPEAPQGAPMVSHEGACRAYYLYRGQTDVK